MQLCQCNPTSYITLFFLYTVLTSFYITLIIHSQCNVIVCTELLFTLLKASTANLLYLNFIRETYYGSQGSVTSLSTFKCTPISLLSLTPIYMHSVLFIAHKDMFQGNFIAHSEQRITSLLRLGVYYPLYQYCHPLNVVYILFYRSHKYAFSTNHSMQTEAFFSAITTHKMCFYNISHTTVLNTNLKSVIYSKLDFIHNFRVSVVSFSFVLFLFFCL